MIISEDNVVEQIKHKNEKAIAYLIRQYGGLLTVIIKRQLSDRNRDYEECLDDVLLAVWTHIHAFDPERNSFKQWVAAIAKYKAIDYRRKQLALNSKQFTVAEIDDCMLVDNQEAETQDVAELLDQLSDQERTIFKRYYLEGHPLDEIAQQFNRKESWVYNKLSRGRKKLRQYGIRNHEG